MSLPRGLIRWEKRPTRGGMPGVSAPQIGLDSSDWIGYGGGQLEGLPLSIA